MQDTILQVFIVALGLLMNPNSDYNAEDWDEALIAPGMRDREQKLPMEEEKLNQEMTSSGHHRRLQQEKTTVEEIYMTTDLENEKLQQIEVLGAPPAMKSSGEAWAEHNSSAKRRETTQNQSYPKERRTEASVADKDYVWIMSKVFSILSCIHLAWKCKQRVLHLKSNGAKTMPDAAAYLMGVDSTTLHIFHSRFVKSGFVKRQRQEEFLDGFVKALLESMQNVCGEVGAMTIGAADLDNLHDVVVPLISPESYMFKCLYSKAGLQMCGQVELKKNAQIQPSCPCQSSEAAGEVLCLLHNKSDEAKRRTSVDFDGYLCQKGSNYLSTAEVGKWFHSTLRQAWSRIAFKYEFEVSFGNRNTPGEVIVRFRSGERIQFTMSPVISYDRYSYFFIPTCSSKNVDWSMSLSKYEDMFLQEVAKVLPNDSCHMKILEITLFLHHMQTKLTGSSALRDVHFKIGLMHLLLTKASCEWRPTFSAKRLQDLLVFMMHSLKTKQLHHVLIGNPQVKDIIKLCPADLLKAEHVNLFHPLVVHRCMYQHTMTHFVELLKNAKIVINDSLQRQ